MPTCSQSAEKRAHEIHRVAADRGHAPCVVVRDARNVFGGDGYADRTLGLAERVSIAHRVGVPDAN
jgi:hypothetical protein